MRIGVGRRFKIEGLEIERSNFDGESSRGTSERLIFPEKINFPFGGYRNELKLYTAILREKIYLNSIKFIYSNRGRDGEENMI